VSIAYRRCSAAAPSGRSSGEPSDSGGARRSAHAEFFPSSEALPGSGVSSPVAVGRASLFEARNGLAVAGFEVLDVAEADGIAYAVGFLDDVVPTVAAVARIDLTRATVEWIRTLPHLPDEWISAESHVSNAVGQYSHCDANVAL
jgi:hypothetical protein